MICNNCGNHLPENGVFCNKCGTRIMPGMNQAPSYENQAPGYANQAQGNVGQMPGYNGPIPSYNAPMDGNFYSRCGVPNMAAPEPVRKVKAGNSALSIVLILIILIAAVVAIYCFAIVRQKDKGKDAATPLNNNTMAAFDFGPDEYRKYDEKTRRSMAESQKSMIHNYIYPNKKFIAKEYPYKDNYVTVVIDIYDSNRKHINYLEAIFQKNGGSYKLCARESIVNKWRQDYKCNKCNGQGTISSGTSTCAICNGTGQMYNPNLYYDANLGWQGGYTVCSGCAGSGRGNSVKCSKCEGSGLRRP